MDEMPYKYKLLRGDENVTVEDLCSIIRTKIQVNSIENDEKINSAISSIQTYDSNSKDDNVV